MCLTSHPPWGSRFTCFEMHRNMRKTDRFGLHFPFGYFSIETAIHNYFSFESAYPYACASTGLSAHYPVI